MLHRVRSSVSIKTRLANPFVVVPQPLIRTMSNCLTVFLNTNQVSIRRLDALDDIMAMFFEASSRTLDEWWKTVRGLDERTFDVRLLLGKAPDVIAKGLNALARSQVREINFAETVLAWLVSHHYADTQYPEVPGLFAALPYVSINLPLVFTTGYKPSSSGQLVADTVDPQPWQHFGMRHSASIALAKILGRLSMSQLTTDIMKKIPNVGQWLKTDLPLGPFFSYMRGLETQFSGGENFRRQLDILWARVNDPYNQRIRKAVPFRHKRLIGYAARDEEASLSLVSQRLHPWLALVADLYKGWTCRTKYGELPTVCRPLENGLKPDDAPDFESQVDAYADWLVLTYKPNTSRSHLERYGANIHALNAQSPALVVEEPISSSELASQFNDLPEYINKEILTDMTLLGWADRTASGGRALRAEGADFVMTDGVTMEDGDAAVLAGLRPSVSLANIQLTTYGPTYVPSFNTANTSQEIHYSLVLCPARYSLSAKNLAWLHMRIPVWAHMGEEGTLPWMDAAASDDADIRAFIAYAQSYYGAGPYPTMPWLLPDTPPDDFAAAVTVETGPPDVKHGTLRLTSAGPELLATTSGSLRYMRTVMAGLSSGTHRQAYLERAGGLSFLMRIPVRMNPAWFAMFSEDGTALQERWGRRNGAYLIGVVENYKTPDFGGAPPATAEALRDILPEASIIDAWLGITLE